MEKLGPQIAGLNFQPGEYTDANGQKRPPCPLSSSNRDRALVARGLDCGRRFARYQDLCGTSRQQNWSAPAHNKCRKSLFGGGAFAPLTVWW
jgi:hypothetical protein